ncbi:winged helix-turn-helix transcriptional regulator [Mesorhizobium sp. B2-4-9]|nr:winged helix-turn-helix transcriptional regulator [Mesorhizobium sp. B2-4-9]
MTSGDLTSQITKGPANLPNRVEYAMTPFGQTLAAALVPLCAWDDAHRVQVDRIKRMHGTRKRQTSFRRHSKGVDGYAVKERGWARANQQSPLSA